MNSNKALNFSKMKYMMKTVMFLFGLFLISNQAFAQPVQNTSIHGDIYISLEEAIQLSLSKSEDMQVLNLDIEKMDALLSEMKASRWFNAVGSAGLVATSSDSQFPVNMKTDMYSAQVGADITQPIYTFGAISNAIEAARKAKNISELSKELGIRSLIFGVAQAYYGAILADENYSIAKSAYDNAVETKRIIESSAAVRPVKSDLIRASADMASRKPVMDSVMYTRENAYRLLKILTFVDPNQSIKLSTPFTRDFSKLDSNDLLATIYDYPELKILKSQSEMYVLQAKAKRAAFYPKLALTGSVSRNQMDPNYEVKFDKYKTDASVGIGLSFTFWDGGAAFAKARQDKIEGMKIDEKYNYQVRYLTNDIIDKVDKYNTYSQMLAQLRRTISLAKESYDMSVSRFKTGKTNALEINDTLNGLTSAQQQYFNTLFGLNVLVYDLEKLTGRNLKQ